MKYSLGISNFLKDISSLPHSLVFLYFFALITEEGFLISPCYSLELCIQMGISFLFSFAFCFSSYFSAIYKASSDNHFAFLHFFFLGMVLIPASCTVSQTSVHSSSGTLSHLVPWIYVPFLGERINLGPRSIRNTCLRISAEEHLFVFKPRAQTETNPCCWMNVCFLDFAFTEDSAFLDSEVYTAVVIPVHLVWAEGLLFCSEDLNPCSVLASQHPLRGWHWRFPCLSCEQRLGWLAMPCFFLEVQHF